MLITAGLVLNCIIFGAMFRPVQPKLKSKPVKVYILKQSCIFSVQNALDICIFFAYTPNEITLRDKIKLENVGLSIKT